MLNLAMVRPDRPMTNRLLFDLFVLPSAANEMEMIYCQMAARSSDGARNWAQSFFESLEGVVGSPSISGLANESCHFQEDIFQMVFEFKHGYSIRALLLIREVRVFVLHVGPCWMDE